MKEKILAALTTVVDLIVPYLETLGMQPENERGQVWPESCIITWAKGNLEPLTRYVARSLDVDETFAESVIVAAAQAHPDKFRLSYATMGNGNTNLRQGRNADGKDNGRPAISLALKKTATASKVAPFVPGQTKFERQVAASKTTNDTIS
jgi:hypothetical protein